MYTSVYIFNCFDTIVAIILCDYFNYGYMLIKKNMY